MRLSVKEVPVPDASLAVPARYSTLLCSQYQTGTARYSAGRATILQPFRRCLYSWGPIPGDADFHHVFMACRGPAPAVYCLRCRQTECTSSTELSCRTRGYAALAVLRADESSRKSPLSSHRTSRTLCMKGVFVTDLYTYIREIRT